MVTSEVYIFPSTVESLKETGNY